MDRFIPESSVLIAVACNIKETFDDMLTEAADTQDENLFDYLEGMMIEFTNRVKGDLLFALIRENNEAAVAAETEEEK